MTNVTYLLLLFDRDKDTAPKQALYGAILPMLGLQNLGMNHRFILKTYNIW